MEIKENRAMNSTGKIYLFLCGDKYMKRYSVALVATVISASAIAAPVKRPAPAASPAPLTYLTAADMAKIDGGAFCVAKFNGRPVYATDMQRGIVRFANQPGEPGRSYRLNNINPKDSENPEADSSAETPNFPMSEGLSFVVSVIRLPHAKPVQTDVEEWATPSRLVINGTTGPAWGSLRVNWVCGA